MFREIIFDFEKIRVVFIAVFIAVRPDCEYLRIPLKDFRPFCIYVKIIFSKRAFSPVNLKRRIANYSFTFLFFVLFLNAVLTHTSNIINSIV
jgi:hypothetical protein